MNCQCDEQLAHSLSNLRATVYNSDFYDFDHANECKASSGSGNNGGNGGGSGNGENKLQCCGSYPNRFEFLTQGGARSCCGSVTYNSNQHDCCNGSVKDFGTCDADIFDLNEEGSGF